MTNFKAESTGKKAEFKDKEKPAQIRNSNIVAAKGIYFIITKCHY